MSTHTKDSTSGNHRQFEAQVSQLLTLLAGALYKNKEVFLRELISNASDACDKLRFESLERAGLLEDGEEMKVVIATDADKKTIAITDSGIGMNETDLVQNLGTIARSGTKEFLGKLTKEQLNQSDLIGQFGVGFYSAFVVADQVEVTTRKAGETQGYLWTSNGVDSYEISPVENAPRGTTVLLHLKEDMHEFLEEWRIREIVRRYADHIVLPIKLLKPVSETEASSTSSENKNEADVETTPTLEEVSINEAQALWTKPKKSISSEQYSALYQHIAHDSQEPLAWAHHKVEGRLSYTSLLYLPKNRPFDLWSREHRSGLKLYVKRVFILDEAEQFLPMYLRFVKGIIDSADLPLNVSREMLQDSPFISTMKNACVKRVLDMLEGLAKDQPKRYQIFWENFGAVLKEGAAEDTNNQERLLKLYRFNTTQCEDEKQTVSLADYVARMPEKQKKIYYCTADSHAACKNSPHLEVFKANNIEVLLLSDRIDEWLMSHANAFESCSFQSVSRGDLEFLKEDKESNEQDKDTNASKHSDDAQLSAEHEALKPVLERMQKVLDQQVKSVKVSVRLTDSAACLVVDDNEMSTHLQRILQEAGQDVPKSQPILELNPDHPIIQSLVSETSESRFEAWSQVLLDQATLSEGGQLSDPARYVQYVDQLLRTATQN